MKTFSTPFVHSIVLWIDWIGMIISASSISKIALQTLQRLKQYFAEATVSEVFSDTRDCFIWSIIPDPDAFIFVIMKQKGHISQEIWQGLNFSTSSLNSFFLLWLHCKPKAIISSQSMNTPHCLCRHAQELLNGIQEGRPLLYQWKLCHTTQLHAANGRSPATSSQNWWKKDSRAQFQHQQQWFHCQPRQSLQFELQSKLAK